MSLILGSDHGLLHAVEDPGLTRGARNCRRRPTMPTPLADTIDPFSPGAHNTFGCPAFRRSV